MLRFIVLILAMSLLSVLSQAQQDTVNQLDKAGRKTGYWVAKYPEGQIMYEGYFLHDQPVGVLNRYYPNGKLKARLTSLDEPGLYDGQLFDEEGLLRASGNYQHQKKHGEWKFFSGSGVVLLVIPYQNDTLSGSAKRFYSNGELMEETTWRKAVLNGPRVVYSDNGKKILECSYVDDKMDGVYKAFNEAGYMIVYGRYEAGLKTGKWQYFNEDGSPRFVVNFTDGIPDHRAALDSLENSAFSEYEKNRLQLKDPLDYLDDPFAYIRR